MANFAIAASADDIHDMPSGGNVCSVSTVVMSLGRYRDAGSFYDYKAYMGLRFLNINIPAGSTIDSAKITFTAAARKNDAIEDGNISPVIGAEAVADAAAIDCVNREPSDLYPAVLTAHTVTWDITDGLWTENNTKDTPSLTAIIQEVIEIAGWASGNDILILIDGVSAYEARSVYSYDGDPAKAPVLVVTWTAPPSGPAGVKTINDLAIASVKTINDLATGSIKTINDSA